MSDIIISSGNIYNMVLAILGVTVLGVIISVVIGTIWYSPGTPMGRLHMRFLGFDQLSPEEQKHKIEEAKPKMPKIYGMQMLLSFLTSFATVFIMMMSIQNGVPFSMALAFVVMNWLCFMVPVIGSNILWGTCDPAIAGKKFVSDIASNFVTVLFIAVVAGVIAHVG